MKKFLSLFILIGFVLGLTACGNGDKPDDPIKTYTITFNANADNTTGIMATQSVAEGATVTLTVNTFEREGYTFEGWSISSSGSVVYGDGVQFTMGTADVILYAIWAEIVVPTYTITFNANADNTTGTMAPLTNIEEGSTVTLTTNTFARTGYSFEGWSLTESGSVAYGDGVQFTMGAANVNLYAVWEEVIYTITFNANADNATGTMGNQSVQEGSTVTLTINAFTRAGYTFAGWSLTAGGTVAYENGAQLVGTQNLDLFAVWIDDSVPFHDIIFNPNGGSGTMSPQNVAEGSTVALRANSFTPPAGQRFIGWSLTESGTVAHANQSQFTMGTADVILYAVWETIPIRLIIFNSATGSGTMGNQSVPEGSTVSLNLNTFTPPAGHEFSGWAISSGGSVVYGDGAQFTMGTANVTLYAVWIPAGPSISIIFHSNGGTGNMSPQSAIGNTTMSLNSNTFSRQGHTFAGWAMSAFGAIAYLNGASITVQTSDVNLYAIWDGPQSTPRYLVTFDMNGGTSPMPNSPFDFEFGENLSDIHIGDANILSTRPGFYFWGFWDALEGGQRYYRFREAYPNDWWLEMGREGDPSSWDKRAPTTLYARWSTQMPPWWLE